MKENWETIIPKKSNNHVNDWADYIELCCLIKKDIISKSDALDIISDALLLGDSTGNDEVYDKMVDINENDSLLIDDAFSILQYREKRVGSIYPFAIDRDYITLKPDFEVNNSIYVFLLLASCTRQVKNLSLITGSFESLCGVLIGNLSFAGLEVLLTGTSSPIKEKSDFERVSRIGEFVNSSITRSFENSPRYKSPSGGDGGVDIILAKKFCDNNGFIPLIFCQCTCSKDKWINKQADIDHEKWLKRLSDIPKYIEMMFLPFSICGADGKIENPSDIRTCVIDRYRMIDVINEYPSEKYDFIISESISNELLCCL